MWQPQRPVSYMPAAGYEVNSRNSHSLPPNLPYLWRETPLYVPIRSGDRVMEPIGCAASISQLAVYLLSTTVCLKKLYNALRSGDSIYRNEATNLELLLNILQRLRNQKIDNHDPVLPVLIAISGHASEALHLLQPRTRFGINWTPITCQDKTNLAFESIQRKTELLHLYISQSHHTALVDLRQTIDKSTMANPPENPPDTVFPGDTGATGASSSTQQPRSVLLSRISDNIPLIST